MIRQIRYFQSVVRNNSFQKRRRNAIFPNLLSHSKFRHWNGSLAFNCWKERTVNFRSQMLENIFIKKVWY